MTEIARLLTFSLQAHKDAKRARYEHKPEVCRELWQRALNARVEAHALDPRHLDPIWREEQAHTPGRYDTHSELLQFYAERGVVYQGDAKPPIPAIERVPTLSEQLDSARAEITRLTDLGQKVGICHGAETPQV